MSPVEKKWLENFEKLKEYRQHNVDWPTNDRSKSKSELNKLSNFCQLQRKAYNENLLREDYLELLISINFNFEGREDNWKDIYERIQKLIQLQNSVSIHKIGVNDYSWINRHWNLFNEGSLNDYKYKAIEKLNLSQYFPTWEEKFQEVKDWMALYNDNFPTYVKEPKLNSWLMSQRISFKKETLIQERAEQLRSVGFELAGLGNEIDERVWKENFEDYKVFLDTKKENSTILKIDPYLYNWVQTQRAVRAGNAANRLDLAQWKVNLLKTIDFKWSQKEVLDEQWNTTFKALKQFLSENKSTQIKSTEKSSSQLYTWIRKQLSDFNKGKLVKDREKLLSELGLIFNTGSSSINFDESILDLFLNKVEVVYFEEFNKKILKLNKLLQTDKSINTQTRLEHNLQQQILFEDGNEFECAFCQNIYPRSFMVAAHIKQRKYCVDQERLDFNVVIPACKFGCDELFERGYIAVCEGEIIDLKKTPITSFMQEQISKLAGKDCKYFNLNRKKYFDSHYSFHSSILK